MTKLSMSENILSDLPGRLSRSLFAAAPLRRLKDGERLFAAGEAGDSCYRVERGLLKVEVASPRGEERIVALLGVGAIVGELSMIDGLPRSASVVALRESELRFVSREAFESYMAAHPEAYRELVAILSLRLREADESLAAAAFLSVRARVARALLELAAHLGKDAGEGRIVLDHRIGQGDLAAMAGVARENVSRVLSEFRQRKLLSQEARHYCLHDVAGLRQEIDNGH
jgi:CRP/FNR family cyclic AMP-dependent transcriptional regulator